MKHFILFITLILISGSCFAQGPENELEEVLISGSKKKELGKIELSNHRIESKLAPDLGAILVLLPGIQVRSYGDVGGLKTAGFRSLGANHTSIVIDQQEQPVTQSGSTDLSTIPSEFLRSVSLTRQEGTNVELPIHAKLAGALIRINTIHQPALPDSNSLAVGFQSGSFGYYSADLAAKLRIKRFQFAITAKGRTYTGYFPFTYLNYQTTTSAIRKNNALIDGISTASLSYFINEKNRITCKATVDGAQKQLAGAVVFYNETANQHLRTSSSNFFINHTYNSKKASVSSSFTYQNSNLTYLDSNYLNTLGYLKQEYQTRYFNAQSQWSYKITEKLQATLGTEFINETIVAGTLTTQPNRTTLNQFGAFSVQVGKNQMVSLQLGTQRLIESRNTVIKSNSYWLPALHYSIDLPFNIQTGLIARYTVRQPTFSELYYQQIGTLNLKPEEASIISVPILKKGKYKRFFTSVQVEPFFAHAKNKIVAIPTKNLFVWSIQNIGISQSLGIELFNESSFQFTHSRLTQTISFTYQEAIDLTDSKSSIYRNQLTYIPKESGSYELSFLKKNWSVYSLFTFQGMRYALQENIPSNEVPAFYTIDIGGSYSLPIKQQRLKFTATVKNITNQYNQYIRYFVLPGINYQFKISYAI